ncbi:amidohydrolase [Tuberibacillus sp. Marseille-P3662]|uniref:amidohydrolase n=1 Tax=Tuberibacillus sp. Marseille-P3662 TaxID=1965358 RepID=UPI000A1CEA6F|nr:amidohydrolase [Tuberibacillus sp. Marseille-P3662]
MTVDLKEYLKDQVSDIIPEVIEWRRYLHQYPEISYHEYETAQFVADQLSSFGNIEITRPTETSVIGRLIGDSSGPVLGMRADMDALPIEEQNDFEFTSKHPGVMHACGHDGHTAMLLGTAKILSTCQASIEGEIRFIFQHAEELQPGGAEELVQTGVVDDVNWIIGAHLWTPIESGKVGIIYGPMMASPDMFHITINGKGGHAAMPHSTVDSIAIGSQVVTNLQHVVARYNNPIEPLVLSVTQFNGGTAHNVIPGAVSMTGTVRSFNPELRADIPGLMERVVRGITDAHGASYEFEYIPGYRPVINEKQVTRLVEETVTDVYGTEVIEYSDPVMAGEDFSGYQHAKPGAFFFIGAGNQEKGITYPHHHERFTIDEDALRKGVDIFTHAAFKFFNKI